jgi:hypothetical protein
VLHAFFLPSCIRVLTSLSWFAATNEDLLRLVGIHYIVISQFFGCITAFEMSRCLGYNFDPLQEIKVETMV